MKLATIAVAAIATTLGLSAASAQSAYDGTYYSAPAPRGYADEPMRGGIVQDPAWGDQYMVRRSPGYVYNPSTEAAARFQERFENSDSAASSGGN